MLTNRDWERALSSEMPHEKAVESVRLGVQGFLAGYAGGDLTTSELFNAMLGEGAKHLPSYHKQRFFKVLQWLAIRDLAPYCHRGEPRLRGKDRMTKLGGRPRTQPTRERPMIRPWLWHAAREPHFEAIMPPTCPHCGGLL